MNYLKKYITSILIIIISLLALMLLLTLLSYFDLISNKAYSILEILFIIITMFISGFITGKKSTSKGYLEGLKVGIIFYFLLILINIIFIKNTLN